MSSVAIPLPSVFEFDNNNNQYFVWGPCVDGLQILKSPPVYFYITDLSITLSLYSGRDISNPAATPGTLVTAFGTGGSFPLVYSGTSGVYQGVIPSFAATPGTYILVVDAPVSGSGYQGHWEKTVNLITRQK